MDEANAAFTVALGLAVLVLISVATGMYFVMGKKSAPNKEGGEASAAQQDVQGENRNARRQRNRMRAGLNRRQRGRAAEDAAANEDDGEGEDDGEDYDDEGEPLTKKEAKKRAAQEAREAREASREAKDKKADAYEQKRRAKEAEREAQEAAQQAEIEKAEEERRKKEDEEAAKWMSMITVDEGGTGEDEVAAEDQGLLSRFVDFIKERKTVLLEEVAAEFGLRVTDVINRLQGLEEMGRITGVMDDRGKYIYISVEEMTAVAEFIKTRGRISISELAKKSNTFIDLESKASAAAPSEAAAAVDFNIDALDEAPDTLVEAAA